MGSSATTTLDPQTLQQIQALLNDPIQGPKIRAMLKGQSSGLGSVAQSIAGQSTPSGQIGAGVGAGIGLGLKALLNKNKGNPMAGRNPNIPGGVSAADAAAGPGGSGSANRIIDMPDDSLSTGLGNDIGGADFARGGRVKRFRSTKAAPGNLATHPHKGKFAAGGECDFNSTKGAPGNLATHPGKEKFAEGGEMEEPPAKKPRAVLVRRPLLSTTIVIAKKPPGKAKAATRKKTGGRIHAKKPNAIPPEHGPGNGDSAPAPFRKGGHVQSPRGAGIAERGKRFQGIF